MTFLVQVPDIRSVIMDNRRHVAEDKLIMSMLFNKTADTQFVTVDYCIMLVGEWERTWGVGGLFIPRAILKLLSVCLCFCVWSVYLFYFILFCF